MCVKDAYICVCIYLYIYLPALQPWESVRTIAEWKSEEMNIRLQQAQGSFHRLQRTYKVHRRETVMYPKVRPDTERCGISRIDRDWSVRRLSNGCAAHCE